MCRITCFQLNDEYYSDIARESRIFLGSFPLSWEQRKLGEISDKVTEKNAGLQYIETFTNSAEFGIISQKDFFDHSISKIGSLGGYYIVRSEDFVYNPRISVTAPVGPINRNKLGRNGVMSPLYTVFRPHEVDNTFLEHFFKSRYWHAYMNFNGDSGARSDRFSIKDDLFFQMPIPLPHIDEQKKIGECLTNLDNLITLHQREDVYCFILSYSNRLLLLSHNAITWEQRKLSALCSDFKSGDFIKAEDIHAQGEFPVYGGNGLRGFTDRYNHEGDYALIGRQGALCGNMNYSSGKAYFTEHAVAVKANSLNETLFLFYRLGTMNLGQYSGQSAQPGLAVGNLLALETKTPRKAEQQQVGAYFRNLDNLITLHQRKPFFLIRRL